VVIDIQPDLRLPPEVRVAILSDLHLGDGTGGDLFGTKDDLLLAVLAREAARADVVVVNGDAVDHMQARTSQRMEAAHPRVFAALRETSKRKPLVYVYGNHENLEDLRSSFPDFDFVTALRVGDDLCITHGHQFDLHWSGQWSGAGGMHSLARLHSLLESAFGQPIRQPFRDYDNWLNRVVHRLFFRYTQALRAYGALWRLLGKAERYEFWQKVDNFWARGQWGDLGCIFQMAERYLRNGAPWRTLVLGHSHQPGVVRLEEHVYANAGSWALDLATFGRVEGGEVRVFDAFTGREYGDERYRMLLSGADLPDMAGWFRRYYRPFFRYDIEAIRRDFPPA
jgi:UDP-2,3-diacylglucosamine pyrophosphatase LpxH